MTQHVRKRVIPVGSVAVPQRQKALRTLAGSGKGLWGKHSAATLRRLRDEWHR